MFELTTYRRTEKKLSPAEKNQIRDKIVAQFEDFDALRSEQLAIYDKMKREIYLLDEPSTRPDAPWKSDVRFHKLYALYQTRQAFLWDNLYANLNLMFDVEGLDDVARQYAPLQKAVLVSAFEKMHLQRAFDKALEFLDTAGEMCFFVSWKKIVKHIRRPRYEIAELKLAETAFGSEHFGIYEQVLYDGAYVDAVNPLNLVFSPDIDPEIPESWDSGAKILKSFETVDSICANKLMNLSDDDKAALRRLVAPSAGNSPEAKADRDLINEVVKDGKVEVLQYWGDFTMPDGTLLKNRCAFVIGRTILAGFQENPFVMNPIINVALTRHVETKRGIPVLYSVYDLCLFQEKKANLENDSQTLALNPPRFAPEGFFKKDKTSLEPGGVLEYKKGLEDPSAILPVNVMLINNEQIINYLDNTISTVSGIYPNMQGAEEFRSVTATEIRVKLSGQTTRIAKDLDVIKQNGVIVLVEKVAELLANMRYGTEFMSLPIGPDNASHRAEITDRVRRGLYAYRYTDNAGFQKKIDANQQLLNLLSPVWNDASVPLDKTAVIKSGMITVGIENPDKFFLKPASNPQAVGTAGGVGGMAAVGGSGAIGGVGGSGAVGAVPALPAPVSSFEAADVPTAPVADPSHAGPNQTPQGLTPKLIYQPPLPKAGEGRAPQAVKANNPLEASLSPDGSNIFAGNDPLALKTAVQPV